MREICKYDECTGCMACTQICSHNAIKISVDDEGFQRPVILEDRCVDCSLCSSICPINAHPYVTPPQKIFSGWSNDDNIRINSSSGGAFTAIARCILQEGGVVFGCALSNNLIAEHTYVETIEDLKEKLQKSKYVQSSIGNSYKDVKAFLKKGRKVLFSGTPCQIAGLRNFLRKDYDNLYTIDLICHGVPSPLIFDEYKKYIEQTKQIKLEDIKFRCKKSSWIFFNMTYIGHVEKIQEEKILIGRYYDDPYTRGFLRDYFLRPSCHKCHFTSIERCADFTIADWWGYKPLKQEKKDFEQKGVSLLFCNTNKSLEMMEHSIRYNMILRERSLDEALQTNSSLSQSFKEPTLRKDFWNDYRTHKFSYVVDKYMYPEKLNIRIWIMYNLKPSIMRSLLLLAIRIISKIKRVTFQILRGITPLKE